MAKLSFTLITFVFVISHCSKAQDIHFSQYMENPLMLNPALTANLHGDWQAGLNYRKQWTKTAIPYNTIICSYEKKVLYYSRMLLVGGYFLIDQVSPSGLTKLALVPSIAYRTDYLGNTFKLGLQPGIGYYSINRSLSHPDQFNYETGKFDGTLPTNDIAKNYSKVFADISLGVTWSRSFGGLVPLAGIAFNHLNRPKTSFYKDDATYRIPLKTQFHFKLPLKPTDKIILTPSTLIIRQRKSQEFIIGTSCSYNIRGIKDNIETVFCGAHYRNAKTNGMGAIVLICGIELHNLKVAVSYDEYFNSQKNISPIGSTFEVTLTYKGINTLTDKFSIPCDFY